MKLKKALKSLPKTLYETYDRTLSNIDEEYRRDALRILQWLAFSFQTISLEEGVEVLATDPDADDEPLFDLGRRPWDPKQLFIYSLIWSRHLRGTLARTGYTPLN